MRGVVCSVDVVLGGADAGCGLEGDQGPERSWPPSGFFFELACCGVGWRLVVLDLADRDLPAPGAGDEPVPPDEQDPLVIVGVDGAGAGWGADQAVCEVTSVGEFEGGESYV